MEILKYKDYEGGAEVDLERGVCRGKILFIDDLVTYESEAIKGLQKQFEEAVDDYIDTCAQVGKAPQKACKGLFNVRVSPILHREAIRRAIADDSSLNDVVRQAMESYLMDPAKVLPAQAPMLDPVLATLAHAHHGALVINPPIWPSMTTSVMAATAYKPVGRTRQPALARRPYAISAPDSVQNIVVEAEHDYQKH